MQGLELSKGYFEEYGMPMLEEKFPELLPSLAAGLFGSGSECSGFDDDVSQDHDFEPGFCLILPEEQTVSRREAFLLEREYAKLPKDHKGFRRPLMQPVGGPRRGVFRLAEILKEKTGHRSGDLSLTEWLHIPEQNLYELTNGEIYFDNFGELTRIRSKLAFYPEDVRKKKLSAALLGMAQSGQYNYQRCLDHGEPGAAQLAVFEFVKSAVSAVFLLNRKYQPYYKWSFRALRDLPLLSGLEEKLVFLMISDNQPETSFEKYDIIEEIASAVISELEAQHLTAASCGDLEKHAYSISDAIADPELRNL